MCGIAGGIGGGSENLYRAMTEILHHRGPDDRGTYWEPNFELGLSHTRLSIIDTSDLGHQPMFAAQDTVVIVYNGEIYNHREIRNELDADGCEFSSNSDTEVLLQLYLRDGPSMLDRLNGIFAFAIWDGRTRRLLLARDGMGVKPLYYTSQQGRFRFASEIKALLCDPQLRRDLNPQAIHSYLTYIWAPAPQTIMKDVLKLEPGHAMLIDAESAVLQHWRYYDAPTSVQTVVPDRLALVEATSEHIRTAVERQLVSDVPLGGFLSGGLDSSAIAVFASQALGARNYPCFTIDYGRQAANTTASEGFVDDLPYARRVAEHLGLNLHVVSAAKQNADALADMVYHLDEPLADPAPLAVKLISRTARDAGMKVLLSGAGGDDIFTGYRRHFAVQQERFWSWLPTGLRSTLQRATRLKPKSPLRRRIAKAFQYAHFPENARLASYFYWVDPKISYSVINPNFHMGLESSEDPLIDSLQQLPDSLHNLNKLLYLDAKFFLTDHNLAYTDKMSMAEGVETRVPFLDPDLMDFAARLPIEFKQRGNIGKWVFKQAMRAYLPEDIIFRPKTGFGTSIHHLVHNSARDLSDDVLTPGKLRERGIFDADAVTSLRAADERGEIYASSTLLSIICIELWCRRFLDVPNPQAVAL